MQRTSSPPRRLHTHRRRQLAVLASGLITIAVAGNVVAATCRAESAPTAPRIVELYTSEGCDSCPPADRWLSSLSPRDDLIALAFHVDYWDRLGWVDRFGSPAHSRRQAQLQVTSGAGFSYTPQVIVDGRDWRRWPGLPAAGAAAPPSVPAARIVLERRDDRVVTAQVEAAAVGPAARSWSAYWAVTEDGHRTEVRAGENRGATLQHDHVVVHYEPIAAWPAGESRRFSLSPPRRAAGRAQRVVLVVVDERQRPVHAASLRCPD